DRRAKGNQFVGFYLVAISWYGRERQMRIDADIAVPRKMLRRCESAIFFDAPDFFGDKLCHLLRVFAERADIDNGIVWIIVDVGVGREDPAHARSACFKSGHFSNGIGRFWIARR